MQEITWMVNICFSIVMIGLFVWDFKSYGEPTHKDFKSIIMSIGVLGTFVGIFIGLIGFDTNALQDSVPLLLDGLKTAFYTSIVGMGLAIALAIIQRAKGVKSAQDANMDYIINQVSHLSYLSHIEQLSQLPSKADMVQIQSTTNAILESSFKNINQSLQKAIEQLASGASKELISALELVIRDFNHNLQNQFGDNFKELNKAVGALLEWQDNYKSHIEQTNALLLSSNDAIKQSVAALQDTQNTLDSITNQNNSALECYEKNISLIESLSAQSEALRAKLESISALGDNAKECLNSINHFFEVAKERFVELESSAETHIKSLDANIDLYFDRLSNHADKNFKALNNYTQDNLSASKDYISNLLEQHSSAFAKACEDFSNQSQVAFESVINTANKEIIALSSELDKNIAKNIESSAANAEEFAKLREHIATNHTAIVESIESNLSRLNSYNEIIMQDMSKGIKAAQDEYLQSIESSLDSIKNKESELIKSRIDSLNELATKTDSNLNAQYEQVNHFLKKIANEYLKLMQKLTKDAVAVPKDMGAQVIREFSDLQNNLLSHLGNLNAQIQHNSVQLIELYRNVQNILNENIQGNKSLQSEIKESFVSLDEAMNASMENFKDNYEWFLRRVREIIGSR